MGSPVAERSPLDIQAIQSKIREEQYHVFPGTNLTVCCLTLENGYTVTGESACIRDEDFSASLGEEISYKKAVDKIFDREAYLYMQEEFMR